MRTGIVLFVSAMVISVLLHVAALLVGVVWAGSAKPYVTPPTETVTVDIVPSEELPPAPKLESASRPTPKPESAEAASPRPPPPPATASSQSPFDPTKLAAMFPVSPVGGSFDGKASESDAAASPTTGFDAPADKAANLAATDVAAFKAHLRKCWTLPAGVTTAEKLRIVLRLSLKPDGALRAQPMLLEASASPYGPAVVESIIRALRECQPYNFLPADKYTEWKVLDVSFSPRDMAGS
jgi:hypothetical protein